MRHADLPWREVQYQDTTCQQLIALVREQLTDMSPEFAGLQLRAQIEFLTGLKGLLQGCGSIVSMLT